MVLHKIDVKLLLHNVEAALPAGDALDLLDQTCTQATEFEYHIR